MNSSARRTSSILVSVVALLVAACSLGGRSDGDDDDDGGSGGVGGSSAGTGTTSGGQGGSNTATGGATTGGQGGSVSATGGGSGTTATGGTGGTGGSGGSGGTSGGPGTGGVGQAGTGGSMNAGSGGADAVGGAGAAAGTSGSAGSAGGGELGNGTMMGMGRSSEQYETAEVGRNDVPYLLITNGWGPGFESHTVSWNGTSFIVEAMSGSRGSGGQPASYPTVFCGRYSVMQVPDCGLPRPLSEIGSLRTGWRWAANGSTGTYNAAYDIWLGTETGFGMYLMVWLRDPPGEQPAGTPNSAHQAVTVANVPGVWDIWNGTVNNRPIINWVRREGSDSSDIEFDVLDFIRDAEMRGLTITGTHVNAVAVGFEIWQGPVTNLESVDFYVDVQ